MEEMHLSAEQARNIHLAASDSGADQSRAVKKDSDDNSDSVDWIAEIDNFQLSPPSSHAGTTPDSVQMGFSDMMFANLVDMGFSTEMIYRTIDETGPNADILVIIDTINKYSKNCEAGSSKSKVINHFLGMGFNEENVIKAIHVHGEENEEQILNTLLSCGDVGKLPVVKEEEDYMDWFCSDDEKYFDSLISDDEDPISSTLNGNKKRRIESKRDPRPSADYEPVCLPIPMPNEPHLITRRSLPDRAQGPPYFYYENIALAPTSAWDVVSSHLYDVAPEFVDSEELCAAARKRGYVHNLPIDNRFQRQPPPKYTIREAFPLTRKSWPTWDTRTKLSCIPAIATPDIIKQIREALEAQNVEPPLDVQRYVINQCKKWNLIWVGENRVETLEPAEMETLLGFPKGYTRGMNVDDRYESLANCFQVDTVAYHLSVLKRMYPNGINVLSLFSGIGGAEVALARLHVPMNTVVSVEISEAKRNCLRGFWERTEQKGVLREFADVRDLTNRRIEKLMKQCGGFDLVIGGVTYTGNRVCRSDIEGEQSLLFFEYCRILEVVRQKTAAMGRYR